MTKISARMAALALRKEGYSYSYIAEHVRVSKSTVSMWVGDLPYTPNRQTLEHLGNARTASAQAKARAKQESFREAESEAQKDIPSISRRDLFILGLGLYIGEGAKSHSSIRFSNADPRTMALIVRWFVEAIGVPKQNLKIRLHLYPDSNEEACKKHWSKSIDIPTSQFFNSIIDVRGKKGLSKRMLPHGTAHLTVNSLGERRFGVFLARKILAWSNIVLGR